MAYGNKKVKILSGASTVKIFNPRNAVDLRPLGNNTPKKKINLPSRTTTTSSYNPNDYISFGTPATQNTALQNFLQNNIINTRSGTMFSPITTYGIMSGDRAKTDAAGYTQKVNLIFKGGAKPKPSFWDTKPSDYVKSAGTAVVTAVTPNGNGNGLPNNFFDNLFNLLGGVVRDVSSIPRGAGDLLSGTGAGVASAGEGVEGAGKALDNNFMWIAVGLVAVLLLTKK